MTAVVNLFVDVIVNSIQMPQANGQSVADVSPVSDCLAALRREVKEVSELIRRMNQA